MAGARKVSTLLFKSPAVTMPWRTSASIVVLAPSSACPPNVYSVPSSSEEEGVESDYKVCLVKRNARSSSFADAMVFPGGAIDRADHTAALRFFANPTTCSAASTAEELEEAAFKIGAARELTWSEMAAAAVEAKQVATSVGTLFDWCSFITPDPEAARLKKGGFFTKFYGAVCDAASVPSASADDAETVMLCWLSPQEALAGAAAGKFFLAPPQYFILTQLAEQCKTMSSVVAHASSDAHRLTREYPIKPYPMKKDPADDTASSVAIAMPGDELHPVFPGLPGCKNRIYMSDKLGQLAAGTSYTFTRKNLDALQFPLGEAKIGMFQTVGKAKL
eukprot:gene6609-9679_t